MSCGQIDIIGVKKGLSAWLKKHNRKNHRLHQSSLQL